MNDSNVTREDDDEKWKTSLRTEIITVILMRKNGSNLFFPLALGQAKAY